MNSTLKQKKYNPSHKQLFTYFHKEVWDNAFCPVLVAVLSKRRTITSLSETAPATEKGGHSCTVEETPTPPGVRHISPPLELVRDS